MALEDIAMFRSIPNCVVFYPSDAVSCERAVELAANYEYMTFIRSTRGTTPVIYQNDEIFEIGKAKVNDRMKVSTEVNSHLFVDFSPESKELRIKREQIEAHEEEKNQ